MNDSQIFNQNIYWLHFNWNLWFFWSWFEKCYYWLVLVPQNSHSGSIERNSSLCEQDEVEFVVQSELKRKKSIVSPSDLTIHEVHPDKTVIKKWLSSESHEEDRKETERNGNKAVLGFVTSSSLNNLPLTNVDRNGDNYLPPEYCVSNHQEY